MKLKKLLSAIISTVMCFFLFATSVSADENNIGEAQANIETQDEYAFNAMSRYISLENIEKSSDISISTPVTLNNLDDTSNNKTIYFAISNNSLVGMMTVDKVNGEFASSFMLINYDELNSAYTNATPISLNIIDESLFLFDGNTKKILIDSKGEGVSENQRSSYTTLPLKIIDDTENVLDIVNYNTRSVILNQQLDVNRVSNSSVNGVGICWAAVVAQNVNYMNKTNYTAKDIYNLCANSYTGTPSGNSTWYERAYNLCGIDVTINESATNYNQVYGLLSNYRPINMSLRRTDSSGIAHSHGVSLSGITVLNTPSMYAYYYIVDPNVGRVSVEVPYNVMLDGSNFTYVASNTRTYTKWTRTIYKS